MERQITNQLSHALVKRLDRRSGFVVILAGVFAALRLGAADAGPGRRHEKLACRNASSECSSDDQCCSGRCLPRTGGTGFRCAKRRRRNASGGGGGGGSSHIALGERCVPGVDVCERGSCQEYLDPSLGVICPNGTFCVLDIGDRCPASTAQEQNTLPASACVGLYCARPNGDARDPGVCGTVESVNACTPSTNTCVEGSIISSTYDFESGICTVMEGGPAAVLLGSRTQTTCANDGDCGPDKVCVTNSLVNGTACRPLLAEPGQPMGRCYTGYYACDPNGDPAQECPTYPQITATACTTVGSSAGTYCRYGAG